MKGERGRERSEWRKVEGEKWREKGGERGVGDSKDPLHYYTYHYMTHTPLLFTCQYVGVFILTWVSTY